MAVPRNLAHGQVLLHLPQALLLVFLFSCRDGSTQPNSPPLAVFAISCEDLTCTFTDHSTDADGTIQDRNWYFGDGSFFQGSGNPSHTYGTPGTYRVTLIVTDDSGDIGKSIQVTDGGSNILGYGFGENQFVLIPAGSFQMGDVTGSGDADELPVHAVNITNAFYMQRTEVTTSQWRAVMFSIPEGHYFTETTPSHALDWTDVQEEFLKALNEMYPDRHFRLPTEAEWEYAARAGTTGEYAGNLDEMAWYETTSAVTGVMGPKPVAQKQPNDWGLYDMHGNVSEFVQDWYDPNFYSVSPINDPAGPSTGTEPVVRGGYWYNDASELRSANRSSYPPVGLSPTAYIGFRLVRTQ